MAIAGCWTVGTAAAAIWEFHSSSTPRFSLVNAESVCILFCLLVFGICKDFRRAFLGIGRARQAVLLGLLTLTVFGQINRSDGTYPFVPWYMYSERLAKVEFIEVTSTFASGRNAHAPFADVVPSCPQGIDLHFVQLISRAQKEPPIEQVCRHQLKQFANRYNACHLVDPICRIEVNCVSRPVRSNTPPRRELLLALGVDP
jgi:hypothetical protein